MTRTAHKPAPIQGGSAPASEAEILRSVDERIDKRKSEMVELRRKIHANPEGSGDEVETTRLVAEALRKAGLQPRVMDGGVGVVVDVDLGAPGETFIALRAELDCVKVSDDKPVDYASVKEGLCHACGHDAHLTIVLAATCAIHDSRAQLRALGLRHNFRAIFQPAEEAATGALSMIEQGAVKGVKAILAVHVEPFIDPGVIGLRKGPLTSACKIFQITIKGRSGHSARPFQAIDPIPAAVSITDLFYQLGPRSMDSRYPLALTVASINAGSSFNAIPDQAEIRGTLRTSRLEDLDAVQKRMEAIVRGVAQATGCEIALVFPQFAPPTNNHGGLIDTMARAATDLLGTKAVQWIDVPSLGAEDFAFYQQVVPGAIVRLGAAMVDPAQRRPLHSSMFDIDESALPIGAKFLARAAIHVASGFAG